MIAANSHRSSGGSLTGVQQKQMSITMAQDLLQEKFNDKVAVDRALNMLGPRKMITG